jgi:hypothetical protein
LGAPATGDGERDAPAPERSWLPSPDDHLPVDPDLETDVRRTGLPPKIEAWRRRSATGAMLTGLALGLREALEPERKEPAIVQETSGDPPRDLPVQARLEQLPPRHQVVQIRPWLLPDDPPEAFEVDGGAGEGPIPAGPPNDEDPEGG